MKKRFLSAALAAMLAVTSLSTAAFANTDPSTEKTDFSADDYGTGNATAAEGYDDASNTLTVTSTSYTSIPEVKVTLPTKLAYVANPYRLEIEDNNGDKIKSLIASPEMKVLNNGSSKVAIYASVKSNADAVFADGVSLSTTGKLASTTSKEMAIWLNPAAAKSTADKLGNVTTTYTYATAFNAKTMPLAVTESAAVSYVKTDVDAIDSSLAAAAYNKKFEEMVDVTATNTASAGLVAKDETTGKYKFTATQASTLNKVVYKIKTAAVAAQEVMLFTLDPIQLGVVEKKPTEATISGTNSEKALNTAKTVYYLAEGKTQDDVTAAVGAYEAAMADTDKTAQTTALNALKATVTTDMTKAVVVDQTARDIPGEGHVKFDGLLNSTPKDADGNAVNWSSEDAVALDVSFKIILLPNDAK